MRKWNCRDRQSMPWKNGGGSTTELAIFPPGANLENFFWRLSSACVETAGPFSQFSGVDRGLAILSGDGLILHGRDEHSAPTRVHLDRDTQPYRFPGELAIHAELCGGPVLDLNLMTRRNVCDQSMQRLVAGVHHLDATDESLILLYCAEGAATFLDDASLRAGDLALFEEAGIRSQIKVEEGSVLYLMRVTNQLAR